VNVTAVPFGTTMNPGADGSPVFAFEIQLEPASGPAHAAFGEITCVALLLELVVAVELASGVESAFAFHTQPLTAISVITSPNFFTICFLRCNSCNLLTQTISNHWEHCNWAANSLLARAALSSRHQQHGQLVFL
jgi:hypothetical protein